MAKFPEDLRERRSKWARRRSIVSWCGPGRVNEKVRLFDKISDESKKLEETQKKIKVSVNVKDIVSKFEVASFDCKLVQNSVIIRNQEKYVDKVENDHLIASKDEKPKPRRRRKKSKATILSTGSRIDKILQQEPGNKFSTEEQQTEEDSKPHDDEPILVLEEKLVICTDLISEKIDSEPSKNTSHLNKTMDTIKKIDTPKTEAEKSPKTCVDDEGASIGKRLQRWSSNCSSSGRDTSEDEGYQEINEFCRNWTSEASEETQRESSKDSFRWRTLRRSDAFDDETDDETWTIGNDNRTLDPDEGGDDDVFNLSSDDDFNNDSFVRKNGIRRRNSSIVDGPVAMRHRLPWNDDSKELYQIYSRRSDDMMSSQIETMYDSNTCLDFASYFLLRNGKPTLRKSLKQPEPEAALDIITGPRKILWQNVPEVLSSGNLLYMTKTEINFQEALFEIVTSEGSYVYSLSVMENHFMKHIKKAIPFALTEKLYNSIFSTLEPIIAAAHLFFDDLLELWHQDFMLEGLSDIIETHYCKFSKLYLKYARQSEWILKTYHEETESNHKFKTLADGLAELPQAEKLPLDSFLTLPLQRITRMPLLLKSVIAQMEQNSHEFEKYTQTLLIVETLAQECNDEVGRMRQCEEMLRICQELVFPPGVINFPLIKGTRFLELRSTARRVKKNRVSRKERLEIFLFNDLFLLAKKMTEKQALVCDYCPRSALILQNPKNFKFPSTVEVILMTNSEGKKQKIEVLFDLTSDRERWVNAFTPENKINDQLTPNTDDDKQVIVIHKNSPERPDELALEIGDVVFIVNEQEGFLRGQRLLDGEVGWFPARCCKLITSQSVRVCNSSLRRQLKSAFMLDSCPTTDESNA